MRAAFLPSPADPFICLLWWAMWPRWRDEVDKLYIYLNGDVEQPVIDILTEKFSKDPKVEVLYHKGMVQHGNALAEMTKRATEEYIMFIEDDGFILKSGTVDKHFRLIESGEYDAIGSPRTSSSMDLQRIGSRRFNVDLMKQGDAGIAYWPNFFFCKRADLLKTDLDFNAHQWQKGEYIKELDWTVQPDEGDDLRADTFVWGTIQLRALGLRFLDVPQYHCNPYWDGDYHHRFGIFSGEANWMHSGSLSGSIYGVLTDDHGVPLSARFLHPPKPDGWDLPNYVTTPSEQKEFERRCSFYLMAIEMFEKELDKALEFRDLYIKAVNRLIDRFKLDRDEIRKQKNAYRSLMNI